MGITKTGNSEKQKVCKVCEEHFDIIWNTEVSEWVFRNAVIVKWDDDPSATPCVMHKQCYEILKDQIKTDECSSNKNMEKNEYNLQNNAQNSFTNLNTEFSQNNNQNNNNITNQTNNEIDSYFYIHSPMPIKIQRLIF